MARLTAACNLLKFKAIFWSPMGMPFACSSAATNRCNLPIMCLYYDLLYTGAAIWWDHFNTVLSWRNTFTKKLLVIFLLTERLSGEKGNCYTCPHSGIFQVRQGNNLKTLTFAVHNIYCKRTQAYKHVERSLL